MATRRFASRRPAPSPQHLAAAFIGDVLEGRFTATRITPVVDGRGRITAIDYEGTAQQARVASVDANAPVRKAPRKKPKGGTP